jgi:hypothetical protein
LVGWWHLEPEQVAPGAATGALDVGNVDPAAPSTIEFGDLPYSIEQRLVGGDRAEAVEQMIATCVRLAGESAPPAGPPADAELQLLEAVQSLDPLRVIEGIRFYGPDAGLPLVVAVAEARAGPPTSAAESSDEGAAGGLLGASRDRVLVWAIAAPAGDQLWSLYAFRLGEPAGPRAADVPSIALPPGSRKTMSLRDAQGVTLVAFAGSGAADDWRQSLAGALTRSGWQAADGWQSSGDVWHARYVRGATAGASSVEIQFGPESSGRLAGLLRIVPAASPDKRTEREQR